MLKKDENILVIKRDIIFKNLSIQGLKEVNFNLYQDLIEKNKEFILRSVAENNPEYKQIIPYLVFNYKDKFFLMRRREQASETRLKSKYSLGIGGHIRQEDILNRSIFDWAEREFKEEVNYSGNFKIKPIGILNDDSNEVGQVHVGFVFLLQADSDNIKVKSELKEGNLLTLTECEKFYPEMETWTQIVFNFLRK